MMRIFPMLCVSLLALSCSVDSTSQPLNIDGFNGQAMQKVVLQGELNEISGIAFHPTSRSFIAINDEQGTLFFLDDNFRIKSTIPFGKAGDYEDIAIRHDSIFVLKSNGDIALITLHNNEALSTIYKYTGDKAEFETLYLEPRQDKLLLITKKSAADKERKGNGIYAFDRIAGTFQHTGKSLQWAATKAQAGVKTLNPSAAAIQPVSGNLFVLASIQKLLAVYDSNGTLLHTYPLDVKLLHQPEGIAFDEQGNLYITSEAAGVSPVLIFIPAK